MLSICILLRLSEFGSPERIAACRAALILSGIAGLLSALPIISSWGKSGWRVVGGILIGSMIRLLIGPVGVVIILAFTDVDRGWFLIYLGITYVLFLGADTAIGIGLLKRVKWNDDDVSVHGNLWDCVSH